MEGYCNRFTNVEPRSTIYCQRLPGKCVTNTLLLGTIKTVIIKWCTMRLS